MKGFLIGFGVASGLFASWCAWVMWRFYKEWP